MLFYGDLHIHTALSPCADNEMTPNNIINMAKLKGLDFISITDHNSSLNVLSCIRCAEDKDIMVIPGIEVTTAEEIHVLCLFEKYSTLIDFSEKVSNKMPKIKNRPEIFGDQLVFDENDMVFDQWDNFLLAGCSYTINEINAMVEEAGGVFIPSHIFREGTGLVSILGAVPEELTIGYVEINDKERESSFKSIVTSDAHYLGDILEKVQSFDLEEKSISCLLKKLKYVKKVDI